MNTSYPAHPGAVLREYLGNIERSEFCVTLKILERHHIIQSPLKING
ncbi:hypothetical protein CSM15_004924 [Salmonella enterica subsp. diarizonae]|nr:hypothetical protein [Salmonella enterica subsp. diarizonae]